MKFHTVDLTQLLKPQIQHLQFPTLSLQKTCPVSNPPCMDEGLLRHYHLPLPIINIFWEKNPYFQSCTHC